MTEIYPQSTQDSAEYLQAVHPLGHKLHYAEQRNKELDAALRLVQAEYNDAQAYIKELHAETVRERAKHHELLMQTRALQAAARLIAELAGFEVE